MRTAALILTLLLTLLLTLPAAAAEPAEAPAPAGATANKVKDLELPADQTVPSDEGFVLVEATLAKPGEVRWLVMGFPGGTRVKFTSAGPSLIVSVPPAGGTVAVFAVAQVDGKLTEFAKTLITVQAPAPGPAPAPPGPGPGPAPTPVKGPLHVSIVENPAARTPDQGALVNSATLRDTLAKAGHKLRVYANTDPAMQPPPAGKNLGTFVQKAGSLPALIVQDAAGNVLAAQALPRTEAELLALVNRLAGGQ